MLINEAELKQDETTNEIVAPTFRQDIHRLADVAEWWQDFRYDNIPTTSSGEAKRQVNCLTSCVLEEVARNIAEFCGFSQGMSYSFESPKVF